MLLDANIFHLKRCAWQCFSVSVKDVLPYEIRLRTILMDYMKKWILCRQLIHSLFIFIMNRSRNTDNLCNLFYAMLQHLQNTIF